MNLQIAPVYHLC